MGFSSSASEEGGPGWGLGRQRWAGGRPRESGRHRGWSWSPGPSSSLPPTPPGCGRWAGNAALPAGPQGLRAPLLPPALPRWVSQPLRGLTLSALRVEGRDHSQGLHRHVHGVSALHEHHVLAGRALQDDLVGDFLGMGAQRPPTVTPPVGSGRGQGWGGGPVGPGTLVSLAGDPQLDEEPPGTPGLEWGRAWGWGVQAGLPGPHLFEEHDLQPVREVQALVVRAEGHGEVLGPAGVHDALDWDHAEHALATEVLGAWGPGGPGRSSCPRSAPRSLPTSSCSSPQWCHTCLPTHPQPLSSGPGQPGTAAAGAGSWSWWRDCPAALRT